MSISPLTPVDLRHQRARELVARCAYRGGMLCSGIFPGNSALARRVAARGIAALLGVVLLTTACGGASETTGEAETAAIATAVEPTTDPTGIPEPVPTTVPTATALPTVAPPTPTPTATPQPERTEPAVRPPGDWDVHVVTATDAVDILATYDAPDGEQFLPQYEYLTGGTTGYALHNPTWFDGPLALMVVTGEPGDEWIEVSLPIRPSGSTAWVRTDDLVWSESDHYIEIDVSTNTVRAWDGDELITETIAVTGSSGRPTPLLSGYVDEITPGLNSAYGPWMLTLAMFSESVNTFGSQGGLPKIALHGTNNPAILGQYASNGCIRIPNDIINYLADTVPIGTRVDIVAT